MHIRHYYLIETSPGSTVRELAQLYKQRTSLTLSKSEKGKKKEEAKTMLVSNMINVTSLNCLFHAYSALSARCTTPIHLAMYTACITCMCYLRLQDKISAHP